MTLLELLQLLRKKLWLLIAMPLLFGLITAGVCWIALTNDYTSEVSLYVLSKTSDSDSSVSSSELTASQYLANDISVMVKSDRVVDATAKALGVDSLKGYTIAVSNSTTNRVITLKVTGKDPNSVAKVADELAKQTSTICIEVMNLEAVNIVDSARVPTTPSGPNRVMYTLVAFLAGLFVAIAIIVLMDMLDTSIKSDEEAEELLGLPVLGRMPNVKNAR